jgi:hypothetical protein
MRWIKPSRKPVTVAINFVVGYLPADSANISFTRVKMEFASVSAILTIIRFCFVNVLLTALRAKQQNIYWFFHN